MAFGQQIRRDEVLDDFSRGAIYGYITANPGAHYTRIKEDLGLTSGNAMHHLAVLEKKGFIESYEDGIRKCYVPSGEPAVHSKTRREERQEMLFEAVSDSPGILAATLMEKLGMHASKVSYYMKSLVENGIVRAERNGGFVRYFPADAQD
jgi:predicted transcriptional regulator